VLVWYKAELIIILLKNNLYLPWYSWKIAELAISNTHSLTHSLTSLTHSLTHYTAFMFIYNDYIGTNEVLVVDISKLPSLEIRTIWTIAIEAFKIIKKLSPVYLHDQIQITQNKYSYRYQNTTQLPWVQTTRYGLN
jgi:hypothetical protein